MSTVAPNGTFQYFSKLLNKALGLNKNNCIAEKTTYFVKPLWVKKQHTYHHRNWSYMKDKNDLYPHRLKTKVKHPGHKYLFIQS